MSVKKRIGAAVLALALGFGLAGPAFADSGYRGTKVNGCQAYIEGSNAWTNCSNTAKDGQVATKAWCTAQPTRTSSWSLITKNSTATGLAHVGCTFNVHTGQTLWQ